MKLEERHVKSLECIYFIKYHSCSLLFILLAHHQINKAAMTARNSVCTHNPSRPAPCNKIANSRLQGWNPLAVSHNWLKSDFTREHFYICQAKHSSKTGQNFLEDNLIMIEYHGSDYSSSFHLWWVHLEICT